MQWYSQLYVVSSLFFQFAEIGKKAFRRKRMTLYCAHRRNSTRSPVVADTRLGAEFSLDYYCQEWNTLLKG